MGQNYLSALLTSLGEKMRSLKFIVFILLIALFAASTGDLSAKELYHLVLIPNPTPAAVQTMAELGLPLDDAHLIKGQGLEIPLEVRELQALRQHGIPYTIVQEDLEAYYAEICRQNLQHLPSPTDDDPVHMKYGSMGGFYTFQQIISDLDSMRLLYPNICAEKVVIGSGWNDNPLYMVKISDNPEINEDEPECLIDALHHAREPGAYTAVIYAMWYLLENYGTDDEVTYLVNNREIYFVPVVNPDGLLYNQQTSPGGGGNWRKNRRNNGSSYGVDLNRNYPYQWGYNNSGSSPTPSSETYRGPSAASEPETQAMISFVNSHEITTAMTVHTAADDYLSAYGYANVQPEHYDVHMDYMGSAAQLNGYAYGTCYAILYESNGRTQDWQLHNHDIINVEPEIGGNGFWPPVNQIMPEAAENLFIHLNQFWCAGGQIVYSSTEIQDGYLNPGASENLIVSLFNRGWGTSENITFEIATVDPYITITSGAGTASAMLRRTSVTDTLAIQVAVNCPIGHQVPFTVTIDQGGFERTEEFTLIVGQPDVLFTDDGEIGTANWFYSGGWGLTTLSSHSPTHSFTESPAGNYANNATAYLTLSTPLNLSNASTAWLEFWAKWDIEANYDCAQLEVSTNGSTWTALPGLYTVAGSGIGVQPSGQPVYEGGQPVYVQEHIDLNAYAGQSYFKFRFKFRSDGGVVGDGFNVDDISLLAFTGPFTPPNVNITVEPIAPPIIIQPAGGQFQYTVTVHNSELTPQTFDAWIDALLPNGTTYGPVLLRPGLTLPASGNIVRTLTQIIPAAAPAGVYQFRGHTGQYPNVIWYGDSFEFTKLPSE